MSPTTSTIGVVTGPEQAASMLHPTRRRILESLREPGAPPTEFAATIDNLGRSLVRFGIETHMGKPEAWAWLSAWGGPAHAREFRETWTAALDTLFDARR